MFDRALRLRVHTSTCAAIDGTYPYLPQPEGCLITSRIAGRRSVLPRTESWTSVLHLQGHVRYEQRGSSWLMTHLDHVRRYLDRWEIFFLLLVVFFALRRLA